MNEENKVPLNGEAEIPPQAMMLPHATQIMRMPAQDLMLTPAFDVETAQKRLVELQRFVDFYMKEGEDYGKIPGTPKPTLFKSGADKLCDIYALADTYKLTNRTEDWDRNLFDYEVECTLLSKRTGQLVATGLGSCNSYEGKYRWRENKRKCPNCSKETVIKGKVEYGGGWICWKKEGKSDGCGTKFSDGDKSIENQPVGKIENDDIPTLKNTILKMAKKRAKVDAVLSATRSSGLFTQDMDDIPPTPNGEPQEAKPQGSKESAKAVADRKIAEHKAKSATVTAPPKAAQKPAAAPANGKNGHEDPGGATVVLELIGKGMIGLSGKGLSIVKSEMTADDRNFFNIRSHAGKWTMKADLADKFRDMCRRLDVGVIAVGNLPRGPHAPEKASIPPFTSPGKSDSTDPILMECKLSNPSPGKKQCLYATWDGRDHSTFDKAVWPILEAAKGKPVMFETKVKGQYSNIVRVVRVDGVSFDDYEQEQPEEHGNGTGLQED